MQDGDLIRVDLAAKTLDLVVDDAELERRRAAWTPHEQNLNSGVLGEYLVGSAAKGAVCFSTKFFIPGKLSFGSIPSSRVISSG